MIKINKWFLKSSKHGVIFYGADKIVFIKYLPLGVYQWQLFKKKLRQNASRYYIMLLSYFGNILKCMMLFK